MPKYRPPRYRRNNQVSARWMWYALAGAFVLFALLDPQGAVDVLASLGTVVVELATTLRESLRG